MSKEQRAYEASANLVSGVILQSRRIKDEQAVNASSVDDVMGDPSNKPVAKITRGIIIRLIEKLKDG